VAGLALVDARERVIVATPAMPALGPETMAAMAASAQGAAIIDLRPGEVGVPTMGFVAAIRAIQGDTTTPPVGYVVGIREVAGRLFPLLTQPGSIARTVESVLIRRDGARIELLSPQADGTAAFGKSVAFDTPGLAEAAALDAPGGFVQGFDQAGLAVLAVSRAFQDPPWVLLTKVAADEALASTRGRRTAMVTISLLVVGGLAAILVAAWRHGTSRREALAARRARDLAARLDVQNRFLELVTESQPVGLAVLEADQKVSWVNRALSVLAGSDAGGLTGKPVANAFGPLPARIIDDAARQARAGQVIVESTLNLPGPAGESVVRAQFVPFGAEATADRVLLVAEDVTPVVEAREKRVRLMRQLVATLVKVIDRRDPFAADHSAWVSTVAQAVAEEMELEPALVETVAIAGQLMNLGKILVPEALLTRGGRLTEAELGQVRESLRMGADLVAGVEFDGPVAATLRQLHERWDGQGQPDGLRGDGILLPARIIAVANAFVGMVSPRSWRAGLPVGDAVDRLMGDRGQIFDPNVVLALANRVANRGGGAEWSRIGVPVGEA
jgi:HD-GYP domain-containing protein (c-di-GMP phosphodiesterase class II)